MKIITVALVLGLALAGPALADEGIRYIVPNKDGGGWAVWTNFASYNSCMRALFYGTAAEHRAFCVDGITVGSQLLKPKVGDVAAGTSVEVLDGLECGRSLAQVRMLSGPLQGQTGCIPTTALTRIKPESQ